MSVFGTHNYGKVDRIPGVGHVCTQFFHINFVPLFPVGSYFILEGVEDGDTGVSVPWSGKSILIGYLRAALFVGAFVVGIGGTINALENKNGPPDMFLVGLSIAAALVLMGLFFASYRIGWIAQAGHERAVGLGQRIGFSDETMLMIEVMHGRLTAEQADAVLARRDKLLAEQAEANQVVAAEAIEDFVPERLTESSR